METQESHEISFPCSVDLASETKLGYLKRAQIQWERRIQKSLNSMCNELNIPLAKIRSSADRDELAEKWNEMSTYDIGINELSIKIKHTV